jgi:hypothetical protein
VAAAGSAGRDCIFERLRIEHGYAGGYTVVKDYVRIARARSREVFVPLVHPPADRARFRTGHSITLVQRDFTGDAALDWGYAGLRFSDRGALRFRVSGKYQGETHNKTQDQTHSDHFVSLKCLAAD